MPIDRQPLYLLSLVFLLLLSPTGLSRAQEAAAPKGPPPVPVRVAAVARKAVSDQVVLVGTAEAVRTSTVAAEIAGSVAAFPVREGNFVEKGAVLVRLKDTELKLSLKALRAQEETRRANLMNAEKELERYRKLKGTNSIATRQYDIAYFAHKALLKSLQQVQAEIEKIRYEISQKTVYAPFAGFIAREHTQVGEWLQTGSAVVSLVALSEIEITVDVPERYAVQMAAGNAVRVLVRSVSDTPLTGKIYAVLPAGNPEARTFPVKINLANPDFHIKSGMEALVTFDLAGRHEALVVPKDAVVTAGSDRRVFIVAGGKAQPVAVVVEGYYDGDVAVSGSLQPGDTVVVRGNERLRPGQPVAVTP